MILYLINGDAFMLIGDSAAVAVGSSWHRDEVVPRIEFVSSMRVRRRPQNDELMKKGIKNSADKMRPEYDLRGSVRGKYYERYRQGTNIVLLEPDLAKVFKDSATVNKALHVYLEEHGGPPNPAGLKAG